MRETATKTPVLIIFFNRPEVLKKVFSAVKKAKPATLLLAQDGAREGNARDAENVEKCREIVDNIDWECTVYRNYSDVNLSCDHREFTAIDWAFGIVDRLIILEDDCLPCSTFFPFCDELLEKYKDDERVDRISGYNRLEKYKDISCDYFFSTIAAGYGWATWKRNWERIVNQKDFSFLDDKDLVKVFDSSRKIIADRNYGDILGQCRNVRKKDLETGKYTSWELLVGVNSLINGSLIITPRYNMVVNIGATADATHYTEYRFSDAVVRKMLKMKSYDIEFPLKHPEHVIRDANYEKKHYKAIHKSPVKKAALKLDVFGRRLAHGDFKGIGRAIKRRISG